MKIRGRDRSTEPIEKCHYIPEDPSAAAHWMPEAGSKP